MAFNIKDLVGGGVSKVLDSAKGIIGQFVADPVEKAAAIQALENEANRHQEALILQVNDLEKSYLADTQEAREANAKIQESDKASFLAKNVGYFLDIFNSLIWGSLTIVIILKAFKVVGADVDWSTVLSIYSTVTALYMTTLNFHRSSSMGSKVKQDMIDKMMKR